MVGTIITTPGSEAMSLVMYRENQLLMQFTQAVKGVGEYGERMKERGINISAYLYFLILLCLICMNSNPNCGLC